MSHNMTRTNFILSLGFGILMGIVFPVYASFFVHFKSPLLKGFFIAGCIAAGIMVGGVSFLITRMTILKVVRKITAEMKGIRASDIKTLDDFFRNYSKKDEVGLLVTEFRVFVESYGSMNSRISDSSRLTLDMGERLMSKLDQIFEETAGISRTIEQINLRQNDQIHVIDETTASFEKLDSVILSNMTSVVELISNIDIFRESIARQAELTGEIFSLADTIADKLTAGRTSGNSLGGLGAQMAADTMNAFDTTGNDIGVVDNSLKQIDDISSRTNLLAINTSIEAAKKGLEGSGFRVIAEEIKKLSSGAAQMSENICQIIDGLKNKFSQSRDHVLEQMSEFNALVESANRMINNIIMKKAELVEQKERVLSGQGSIRQLLGDLQQSMQFLKDVSNASHKNMNMLISGIDDIKSGLSGLDAARRNISDFESEAAREIKDFRKAMAVLGKSIDGGGSDV